MASANCLTTVLDNGRLAVFASKYSAAFFGVIDWTLLRTKSAPLLDIAIDQTLATRANRTPDSDPSKVDLDESAFRRPAVGGHRRGCLFAVGEVQMIGLAAGSSPRSVNTRHGGWGGGGRGKRSSPRLLPANKPQPFSGRHA